MGRWATGEKAAVVTGGVCADTMLHGISLIPTIAVIVVAR